MGSTTPEEETTVPQRRHIDLPVSLDRAAGTPLATQLGDTLRAAMRQGTLKHGERLPSSRGLAKQLGVSRTVVTEAFQQLYAEGWLEGRHGSGTYVAGFGETPPPDPGPGAAGPPGQRTAPAMIDLRPGIPWVRDYDDAAWRRAWRRAADVPPREEPDPYGLPRLREAVAAYLRRARAVPAGAADVLVTRGTGNGLDLVAATLLRPGDLAGVEDPGYGVARNVFAARGAHVVPCPVDEDGVIVERLPGGLRVLYTTPAHQYPLGGRLPIPRREKLLAWARRTGAIVVEDDYDAEFRYDVAPLPALYGLDPARVVLLGTLSKSLGPDVGVGWLVAGAELLEAVARTRDKLADRTCGPAQAAVAHLLERGDLERHLRRMRLEYARRRAVVVDALRGLCPLRGETAGLHVVAELPAPAVPHVVEAAHERGVLLEALPRYHQGPAHAHGLVIGYGAASSADLRRAMSVVATLIADL
ncbi:MocR-like pyridoxine biosynthesis transcription factor PdxR [Sinosporangium siamense]|uniref:GntR family transcriptional regulator n=1 Tax=Sinosporangium siamense TaxID=1367973 RepID=A0A919RFT9_9ACTN|nr:PLP-dependent aminotransferase family protein [Sinosporangium siamense]GII92932.1 GntR family transcriptional regulator [Sinosporangium siamense]